jgi:hypothetical protein
MCRLTHRRGFGLDDGFTAPYRFTQFRNTGNTELSLFYTLSIDRYTRPRILRLIIILSGVRTDCVSSRYCGRYGTIVSVPDDKMMMIVEQLVE